MLSYLNMLNQLGEFIYILLCFIICIVRDNVRSHRFLSVCLSAEHETFTKCYQSNLLMCLNNF